MPFIAQCPHPDCRKFQLLEDSLRGAVTDCLVCKQPLHVRDAAGGPQTEAVAPPPVRSGAPARAGVGHCPECTTALKLPTDQSVQSVKCPKCGAVFRI
jgi:hypothetical protein